MSTVADGKVVIMHYTLKNAAGETLDSSVGKEPLPYLQGANNIVVGLEKGLAGAAVGETRDVEVSPAEGYGERQGPGPQPVPRNQFPAGLSQKKSSTRRQGILFTCLPVDSRSCVY